MKLRFGKVIVTALAAVLVAAGCGGATSSSGSAPSTVKLGALFSLTGPAAIAGKSMQQGAQLAADTWNQKNSPKLDLQFQDDQSDPKAGVNGFTQLIDASQVSAVVGPSPSTVAVALKPIANQRKVVLMAPYVSTPVFASPDGYTFRTHLSIDQLDAHTAQYATQTLHLKKVAMLLQDSSDAQAGAAAVKSTFTKAGGSEVGEEVVPVGTTEFQSQLTKLIAGSPDAIYIFFVAAPAIGHAMKEARQLGFKGTFLTPNTIQSAATIQAAGAAAEGAVWTNEVAPDVNAPAYQAFLAAYKQRFGADADIIAANAYDCVMLLGKAMAASGTNATAIAKWLRGEKSYQGVSGTINFAKDGNVVAKPTSLFTIKDGKFVTVSG